METKDLPTIVLMFVLIGLILGVGALVLDKFGEQVFTRNTATVLGESLGAVGNSTPVVFSINSSRGFNTVCSLLAAYNTTGNQRIGAANYTFDTGCSIVAVPGAYWQGKTFSVNYTWTGDNYTTGASNVAIAASTTNLTGIATNWLPLMITIIVLVIIVGLVIRGFGSAGQRQ